jgi:hypothetical protein
MTRSVFDPYNIVAEDELARAIEKKFSTISPLQPQAPATLPRKKKTAGGRL